MNAFLGNLRPSIMSFLSVLAPSLIGIISYFIKIANK